MRFIYKPEGAEPKSWEFNPTKLMNVEAEAIEKHTGMTFGDWADKVGSGSVLAIHGLLYVLLKRTTPTLRWDDVQFCLDDIDFEIDDDEAVDIRDALEEKQSTEGLTASEEEALAGLRAQYPPTVDDVAEGESDPKGTTTPAELTSV